MEIKRFDGNGRMSKAVIHNGTLYLCGQTSREGSDVKTQTRAILDNIEAMLAKYGSDKQHMLSATIYLKDISTFAQMNEIWDSWVEAGYEPARACVEAALAAESILVEVSLIAAVK